MEYKIIRALVVLGVPGVALGVFYLLLRNFNFHFAIIDPTGAVIIAVLFLLIVGGITFYAIHRWAPQRNSARRTILTVTTDTLNALHELDNAIRTTIGELTRFDHTWSDESREKAIENMNILADAEIILPKVRTLVAELERKAVDSHATTEGADAIAAVLKCGQATLEFLGESVATPWPGAEELAFLVDAVRTKRNPEAEESVRNSATKVVNAVNRKLLGDADTLLGRMKASHKEAR